MRLRLDAHSPIPIRWQLTEQLKHVIEGGGVPRDQALPSIRELAGFLGINPNTVARAIEDLKRSGHVEARRGKGVFVAPAALHPPVPDPPRGLSEGRGDPRGGPRDDPRRRGGGRPERGRRRVGRPPGGRRGAPRRVQSAGAGLLWAGARGPPPGPRGQGAPQGVGDRRPTADGGRITGPPRSPALAISRRWSAGWTAWGFRWSRSSPRCIWRPSTAWPSSRRGRGWAWSPPSVETAHNLEHSIVNAALPNIARVEASPAEGPALRRLVRRVDAIVCSTSAAERVRGLVGPTVPVIVDDRALNQRAIQMLGAILAQQDGDHPTATPPLARGRLGPRAVQASPAGSSPGGDGDGAGRRRRAITR